MNVSVIAHRYATALYEVGGADDKVYNGALAIIEGITRQADIKDTLCCMSDRDISDCFSSLCGVLQNFMLVVKNNHRMPYIGSILECFINMVDDSRNVMRFELRVGTEISESLKGDIIANIAEKVGCQVVISIVMDDNIVGGFSACSRSLFIDGTLMGSLQRMSASMLEALETMEH